MQGREERHDFGVRSSETLVEKVDGVGQSIR